MPMFLGALFVALGATFVAEFGDKSQLLILAFATRHDARLVVPGLVLAAAVVSGISVAVGAGIGAALPQSAVGTVAGLAFLAVAAWTLLGSDEEEAEPAPDSKDTQRTGIGVVLAVTGAFSLGELGDKTMLATFALAASAGPIPTWIGATLGIIAANLVAVVVGRQVGQRLSPRVVRIGSGGLFALAGVLVLAGALLGAG